MNILLEGIIMRQSVNNNLLSASLRYCDRFKRNLRTIQIFKEQTGHTHRRHLEKAG